MKCVILVGGLGKRLGEISNIIPKPMVEIDGKPLLERTILHLKQFGILKFILCAGHLANSIQSHFGDGSTFGVNISYAIEKDLLGTGGALKNAEKLVGKEPFILLYGDLVINMDLRKFIQFHEKKGGMGTLVVHPSEHPYDSDMLEINNNQQIIKFLGKPTPGQKFKNIGNAGVYCFEPSIFNYLSDGKSMLDKEVIPMVITKGERLYAYVTNEQVFDIGTPGRLGKARTKKGSL
ncbi:MAG: nucleotidyltransferase family protein [Candidatus Micrarchaeota archaeon]